MNDPNLPPALDRWFARVFNDEQTSALGSGWWSGVASVFLGVLGLGAVITLYFPEYLSSAELRSQYPMPLIRGLIEFVIGVAFLAGCLSMLLRRRKVLGLAGVLLATIAVLLGGGDVQVERTLESRYYLGMDWFLLNLFFLAVIFVPLERAFPRLPKQGPFRFGWTTDSLHFLVSHVAVQLLTFLTLLPATVLATYLVNDTLRATVAGQPLWLQVIEIMLLADVVQYWVHRAFHRVPWLWRFHAVHHSSRALDWLAGSRLHLVDVLVTRAIILLPLFLLGFAQSALYAWLVIIAFHAIFNHVNFRYQLGWIENFLVTPRFHHWHHAVAPIDRNFAVHFPWLDRLFGTHHMPGDEWPTELGLHGHPVPEEFLLQLLYPFRRR